MNDPLTGAGDNPPSEAPTMAEDWTNIRAQPFAPIEPPPEWPQHLRPISLYGLTLLGMDPHRPAELYWDGQRLVTERRLARYERWIAGIVAASTLSIALTDGVRFVRDIGQFLGWWL